jgi:hypothetical protein
MKVGVLFNCQHRGLANGLRALHPDWEVINYELVTLKTQETQDAAAAQFRACDAVLSVPIEPGRWGPLATESLKKNCNVHLLSPVSFSGFHPDTVYVGPHRPEGPLSSPTGHYHSRIAVVAFLAGLSPYEAQVLYNTLVFEKLGYFSSYHTSCAFLTATFEKFGVDITPYLNRWKETGCFMHSINHPKIHVLCDLAAIASRVMGVDAPADDGRAQVVPDTLTTHPQIPMYPEIARRIGYGCVGHTMFKQGNDPVGNGFRLLPLGKYLHAAFEGYKTFPQDILRAADGVGSALDVIAPGASL